ADQDRPKDQARVRQVVSKYNEKTGSTEEVPIEKANIQDEGTESECILRNVMGMDNPKRISRNEIDLGPGPLLDLMKEVMVDKELMVDDNVDQAWSGYYVTLSSPFTTLVHNWDMLKEAEIEKKDDSPEREEARADLKIVLEFVQRSKDLEAYFKNRDSQRSSGIVEYKYLWTVFPVGIEVLATTFLDEKQIMIVEEPPHLYPEEKSQELFCWYYDYNGKDWILVWKVFEFKRYNGTKAINTLLYYPLSYYKEKGESADLNKLRHEFTERGKKFERYCTAKRGVGQMFYYRGQLLSVENLFGGLPNNEGIVGSQPNPEFLHMCWC
ncbi:MAG: hypothetical protein Q9196_003444, partial [Gyalolechia fulgens]